MTPADLLAFLPAQHRRRASSQWYVRGRLYAATLSSNVLSAAIARALAPQSAEWTITAWHRVTDTRGGSEENPGKGQIVTASLRDHVAMRIDDARAVHAKGEGPTITHGISKWAGASDAEALARTGLLLDYDGGDTLGWTTVWPFACIGQLRPDAGKYHIEVPFSAPLELRSGGADKAEWSAMLGWVLGCLSEFAFPGQPTRFFDPLTDRLLQPVHLSTRRTAEDLEPITVWQDGPAMDWFALLIALEFPTDQLKKLTVTTEARTLPPCLSVSETAIVQGLVESISTIGVGQGRWRLYLALAGALRNEGATEQEAAHICEALSVQAGVDDAARTRNRLRCVWHTYAKPEMYLSFNTLRIEYPRVARAFRDVFGTAEQSFKGMFDK